MLKKGEKGGKQDMGGSTSAHGRGEKTILHLREKRK